MNTLRAILVALLLCALSASASAGFDDGGGELPGGGGEESPPALIDASAIIAPMVAQLLPLAVMAIGFGLAVFAVRTGAAMMLEQTGGGAPRGMAPGSGRRDSADEQLARAEGYLAAHKSAVNRARREGYRSYGSSGTLRRYGGRGDWGGNRRRSNTNSSRGGSRRR